MFNIRKQLLPNDARGMRGQYSRGKAVRLPVNPQGDRPMRNAIARRMKIAPKALPGNASRGMRPMPPAMNRGMKSMPENPTPGGMMRSMPKPVHEPGEMGKMMDVGKPAIKRRLRMQ